MASVRGRIDAGACKLSVKQIANAVEVSCDDQLILSFDASEVFDAKSHMSLSELTSLKLSGPVQDLQLHASLVVGLNTNILRFDCAKKPELWIEVTMTHKRARCYYHHTFASDPFEDISEDTLEDCFEELLDQETVEDIESELLYGYKCTKSQAVYWLKEKYLYTTNNGETLYNRLLSDHDDEDEDKDEDENEDGSR